MSKKHRRGESQTMNTAAANSGIMAMDHQTEYRIIKFDLVKVLILNAVYLAVILFLYFSNLKSHFVDNWFAHVLHF